MDHGWMHSDSMFAKFMEVTDSSVKVAMGYMHNNVRGDGYIHTAHVC